MTLAIKDGAAATTALKSVFPSSEHVTAHVLTDSTGATIIEPATSTLQTSGNVLIGAVTETVPASDTASSGLNGRLQRVAQRITSLIALLPTALGQGTMATSLKVVIASDQTPIQIKTSTTVTRILSAAASTNATAGKASAGNLYNAIGYNAAAAVRYLKIYNKATAPTVGTDTPILTLPLPVTSIFNFNFEGMTFATGISFALTTGSADADTGALTAADVVGLNVTYS